jgi:ATP-binding cassette subfamily B protein
VPLTKNLPIIALKSVSFVYESSAKIILHDINLAIDRGSRVGLIGKTGSGKSTLVDLIMGLLNPTAGQLLLENKILSNAIRPAWFRRIAHVPQTIYLSDATIAENVAFGIKPEQIDMHSVQIAAERAQISEFIEGLPDQYQTFVGERGVRLSGGQRQRIGLARAFYKRSDILILDEATSALDDATENCVMDAINSLGGSITVIIIAHRLSTLRNCQVIYELDQGRIIRSGSYKDIIEERLKKYRLSRNQ